MQGLLLKVRHTFLQTELRRRLLKGAFWTTLATLLSRGFLFAAFFLTARILEAKQYGEFAVIQITIASFEVLAIAGMGITASKHVAQFREKDKEKAGKLAGFTLLFSLVSGLFMAIPFYFLAPFLASDLFNAPHLTDKLEIAALILVFVALLGAQTGVLIGLEAFRTVAITNAVSGCFTLFTVPVGALYWGIDGALWGMLVSSIINVFMTSWAILSSLRLSGITLKVSITKYEWQVFLTFALPAVCSAALVAPINWIGAALLVNQTNGFVEMGIYSAANQWFSILLFVPGMILNVLLPVFSQYAGKNNFIDLKRILIKAIKINLLIIGLLAAIVAIFSKPIMSMYGSEYSDGWRVLVVIALGAVAASTYGIIGNAFAAINKMWLHLSSNLLWALVYLSLVVFFLNLNLGALALALSMSFAYLAKILFFGIPILRYFFRYKLI